MQTVDYDFGKIREEANKWLGKFYPSVIQSGTYVETEYGLLGGFQSFKVTITSSVNKRVLILSRGHLNGYSPDMLSDLKYQILGMMNTDEWQKIKATLSGEDAKILRDLIMSRIEENRSIIAAQKKTVSESEASLKRLESLLK